MKPDRLCAFTDGVIAISIDVIDALVWLVPDKRFEGNAE